MIRVRGLWVLLFVFFTVGFNSSCFFRSDYSLRGSANNGQLQKAGAATQLVLTGVDLNQVGVCSGPYTVTARATDGSPPSPALAEGVHFKIVETSGATVSLDDACKNPAPSEGVSPVTEGSNYATFYIKGSKLGVFQLIASMEGLSPASMNIQFVTGSAYAVHWIMATTPQVISSFSCYKAQIVVVDLFGNPVSNFLPVVSQLSSDGISKVAFFSDPSCSQSTRTVAVPAGGQPGEVYIYAGDVGEFTVTATPQEDLKSDELSVVALNRSSPQLVVAPESLIVQDGICGSLTVMARNWKGDPLQANFKTPIHIYADSKIDVFEGPNCSGTPSREPSIAANSTSATFSVKSNVLFKDTIVAATSPNFVSGSSKLTVVGGSAHSLRLDGVPTTARVSNCIGPVTVKFLDSFGNEATPSSDLIEVQLQATSPKESGLKFFSMESCSSADTITKVTAQPNQGSPKFFFQATVPGRHEITAQNAKLGSDLRVVVMQNAYGNLQSLVVGVDSSGNPLPAGNCIKAFVGSKDLNGYPLEVSQSTTLQLSTNQATAMTFSDPNCQKSSSSVTIDEGDSQAIFYYLDTKAETAVVTASNGSIAPVPLSASKEITTIPNIPAKLVLTGVASPQSLGTCSPVVIDLFDAFGNLSAPKMAVPVSLASTNFAIFYSSDNCKEGTEGKDISFDLNTTRKIAYFKSTKQGLLRLIAIGPVGIAAGSIDVNILAPPDLHLAIGPVQPSSSITVGVCTKFYAGYYTADNVPAIYDERKVALWVTGAAQSILFSDSNCKTPLTNPTLLNSSNNPNNFYVYSESVSPAVVIGAVGSDGSTASTSFSFTSGAFSKLLLTESGLSSFVQGATWVGPYEVQTVDALGNPVKQVGDLPISYAGSGISSVQVATNPDGTGDQITVKAGSSSAKFYLKSVDFGVLTLKMAIASGIVSNTRAITVKSLMPIITSIVPNNDYEEGGKSIKLQGGNFYAGLKIVLGGVNCGSVSVVSATIATCTTGAHPPGLVDAVAWNVGPDPDLFTLTGAFTYVKHQALINSIVPNVGPTTGGIKVAIYGSGFRQSDRVLFGDQECPIILISPAVITCTAPAHAEGKVSVTVRNPSSDPATINDGFTYEAPILPVVSSIGPGSGPVQGGTAVRISGKNYDRLAKVTVGGVQCTSTSWQSDSLMLCQIPPGKLGPALVLVTNPADLKSKEQVFFNYEVAPVSISSVSPTYGPISGGTLVTFTGSSVPTDGTLSVTIADKPCVIKSVSANKFTCITSPGPVAGLSDVAVMVSGKVSVLLKKAFNYESLTISYLLPSSGTVAGGTLVTIYGTGFTAGVQVTIDGQLYSNVKLVSDHILTLTTLPHLPGGVAVVVSDKSVTVKGTYYYNAPIISTLIPNKGPVTGGTMVLLSGANFFQGMIIKFDGKPANAFDISADGTKAYIITPPATKEGIAWLSVSAPGLLQDIPTNNAFFYEATIKVSPSFTSINPFSGPTAGGTWVTIRGTNLSSVSRILVGGYDCTALKIVDDSTLNCSTPANSPGRVILGAFTTSGIYVGAGLNYDYVGEPPTLACVAFAQISWLCGRPLGGGGPRPPGGGPEDGNVSSLFEWTAGFVPVPDSIQFTQGMGSESVLKALKSPVHNPSGTMDYCNRVDQRIFRGPMPRSYSYNGVTYDLFTGDDLGSKNCPAYFSQYYSPLIIDLNNEGVLLSAPSKGVYFDISGDGVKQKISWPINTTSSMFLVLDRNGNNDIDSVHELFGNNTVGPDGKKSGNGFEALRKYDLNHDNIIDAKDKIFSQLRLWADYNHNGIADNAELLTLESQGIKSIDLNYQSVEERNDFYGNQTLQRSVVDLKDGTLRRIIDLWFAPGTK